MGLPEINIEFKGKAESFIYRSARGIVVLILSDDTGTFETKEYTGMEDVKSADWTAENRKYIELAFKGKPRKVICERVAVIDTDYSTALTRLNNKRFNYLAIPGILALETEAVATWLKGKRDNNKKSFKVILPNTKGDHEGIINFTTEDIKVGSDTYSAAEYSARIAGVLAGLPFTQSATYFVLDEVEAITEKADPDAAIDAGELILINDGEKIKIGRAVNSLTTLPPAVNESVSKTEDFKKIKVVDVMDMVTDDIRDVFNDQYVGKVPNIYDNQVLFIAYVNSYFTEIAGDQILDRNTENKAEINVEAQRAAWKVVDPDAINWDDTKVKTMAFKSNVFLSGKIKAVDAMEDLNFQIAI